jgi:geranylgeranyl reductase family protein
VTMAALMHRLYDVAVVGAGPAGTVAAHRLSSAGARVLLLEKETLPRYKCCAGGLTVKAAGLLPIDIDGSCENIIFGARLCYDMGNGRSHRYPKPIAYLVTREALDGRLAKAAVSQGTHLKTSCRVLGLEQLKDRVRLDTSAGFFEAANAIAADGVNGVAGRSLASAHSFNMGLGMECRVHVPGYRPSDWEGSVMLDLSPPIFGGYGWIFPKSDHLNVGVGGPAGLGSIFRFYIRRLVQAKAGKDAEIKHLRGSLMPYRRKNTALASGRVLLTGDAAGLMDPLSGEGIYPAALSGRLAAEAIIEHPGEEAAVYYRSAVEREIISEWTAAESFLHTGLRAPHLVYSLVSSNTRAFSALSRLVRGEITYTYIKRRLGIFQLLLRR